MSIVASPPAAIPRRLAFLLILGVFLSVRGYHSRDGDQAYRLPLLLHRQDPAVFADDPFVRAFDAFNPHHGALALLDAASRPLGLSAGLAALFALTFVLTCLGLERLARAVWPEAGPYVGHVAVVLLLIAKAGNIGTNHLFEAMFLDRLLGFALGWVALGLAVARPERGWWAAPLGLVFAALVHPSIGLQLALLLGASWLGWALWPGSTGVGWKEALGGVGLLALAMGPGVAMNLGQGARLFEGLPRDEFQLLSVALQGPQHMVPHLWRFPQWLAWGCYPVLAWLAFQRSDREGGGRSFPPARARLAILGGVNLVGLGLAWVAVEWAEDLRVTLFQPFRMATILRGLALVALSGRVVLLWRQQVLVDRGRAALLVVGLAGDWALVVATMIDVALEVVGRRWSLPAVRAVAAGMVLAAGMAFLARHDTESGHVPLLAALGTLAIASRALRGRRLQWNRRRRIMAMVAAWAVPVLALIVAGTSLRETRGGRALLARCRFAAVPTDEIERLGVWCRDHTPASARFIGPPGPKTFRLWSLRSLAFNRAASPYHAAGLADWSRRFRDHVSLAGNAEELVRAYLADRHGLERRYQAMSAEERAALALRQGAAYIVAAPPSPTETAAAGGPLELLHVEGRYAVYRLRSPAGNAQRAAAGTRPEHPQGPQARTGVPSAGTG